MCPRGPVPPPGVPLCTRHFCISSYAPTTKEKRQPSLFIVHRKQLFDQWIERIQNFLKIPKKEIGQIGNQKHKIGKSVTVAMIQTLARLDDFDDIADAFGTIIIDECHHIPAKSFREAIVKLNSFYLYGLTATPRRKNNDQKLMFDL